MPAWVPLAAVAAFAAFGIALRALLQRLRHGTFGVRLFRGGRDQFARDLLLVLVCTTVATTAVERWRDGAPMPAIRAWPGVVLAVAGLALMLTAQLQLGRSWRIGIDEQARPGLVSHGVYRLSRNPIFTGMLGFLLGFVAIVPTPWTLTAVPLGFLAVDRQVRAEERWLRRAYGPAFDRYAARVGRYLPRFRRR